MRAATNAFGNSKILLRLQFKGGHNSRAACNGDFTVCMYVDTKRDLTKTIFPSNQFEQGKLLLSVTTISRDFLLTNLFREIDMKKKSY